MTPKSISRRSKKGKEKQEQNVDYITTSHVPLCALGEVIKEKHILAPIHHQVDIPQKSLEYRPTDKLVFATLGFIAGAETVYDINQTLRPNKSLLVAFGYDKCADQSVIQQTINAATDENVSQLDQAINEIFIENNQTFFLLDENPPASKPMTMDIDLSPLPASKKAEGSKKGYVPGKKNVYTRQLARVLVPSTSEIVTQSLYPGNRPSCSVFKEMVGQMENHLQLDTKAKRQQILLRLDAACRPPGGLALAVIVISILRSGVATRYWSKSIRANVLTSWLNRLINGLLLPQKRTIHHEKPAL